MKRLFALLLTLCLLLPALSLAAPEDDTLYLSDFTADTDGWYPRSTGSAVLEVQPEGLYISGRSATWNSPGRDFELTPGVTYWFSVDVMQKDAAGAEFILSIAHSRGGTETYENLSRAVASNGEWTTIVGYWTAASYDRTTLYVETSGSGTLSFTIRNFRVSLSEPVKPADDASADELPILKDKFAAYFDLGTCINGGNLRNAAQKGLVLSQYNIVTPENELKPDAVLDVNASRRLAKDDDTAVAVHFDSAKPILDFCKANGVKLHGHVLVWHSQTPEAFFHVGYNTSAPLVSREVMLARLDNYIRQVFAYMDENYPGVIVSWDVVNEAVADGASVLRASNWTKVVGADFVNRAFEIADKYAPDDVLLYYNDYSTPYEPKLSSICKLLTSLVEEGHIDGYGFQTHYSAYDPSVTAVSRAFDRVIATGVKHLRVSEMDIAITKDSETSRETQGKYYAELFKLYLAHADMLEAVQFWGVCDATSWIRAKNPLPFDGSLNPKPAFWSIAGLELE